MIMRPRIKVKAGLQGSSDFRRVLHRKRCLEKAHEEFIHSAFFAVARAYQVKEPSDTTLVTISVFGKEMRVPYKRAKDAGMSWHY